TVFEQEYQLLDLDEVREYVHLNRHLPDVPSAAEVQRDGVSLGDFSMKLLKKIEELTLYVVQQHDTIRALEQRLDQIENR
ncbi:MAG: hypothetical protein L6Q34_02425, partial [Nitrospira sp.]|nr:hypothetical protein [Nitrospira sp.]